jgi:tRNA-dihydrouridine synthase A
MMDWTDRHCRYFHRLISPHVRLYTEMVTTGALIHGDQRRHLDYSPEEHPLALQLGGSEPDDLALCAKMGEDWGYDEINLNCGCPSERVQKGAFGACLMAEPDTVAKGVDAMIRAVSIPVTVKCRIAIDDEEDVPFLTRFIDRVSGAGCQTFIIHARKAWLKGLSPKENREVPPLRYDIVRDMKSRYPHLNIIVNGGITTLPEMSEHLKHVDGVMIGREAYQNPWILSAIGTQFFGHVSASKHDIVARMTDYTARMHQDHGVPVKSITRHMLTLFQGERGARAWRRALSTTAHVEGATAQVITDALAALHASE